MTAFFSLIELFLIRLIEVYQRTLSPDHGWFRFLYPNGFCRYHPSCSEYTKQAIKKYGAFRGLRLGAWRVVRCNPLARGGNDPVK